MSTDARKILAASLVALAVALASTAILYLEYEKSSTFTKTNQPVPVARKTSTPWIPGRVAALVVGDPVSVADLLANVRGVVTVRQVATPQEALEELNELQAVAYMQVILFNGTWFVENYDDTSLRQLVERAYLDGAALVVMGGGTERLLDMLYELGLYNMAHERNPAYFGPQIVGVAYREVVGPEGPYRYPSTLMSFATSPEGLAEAVVKWIAGGAGLAG